MINECMTVTELTEYISALIEGDRLLSDFWLQGEISGFKLYKQSGHLYFTLKDKDTCISAVMFKSRARQLQFMPEDGMEVLVRGYVAVFARQGKYQLYVEEMQPYGQGGLYLYLEKLKKRLESKGYFNPEIKKPIPSITHRVGIVTSADGAALRDIIRVLRLRHPSVDIILAHSSVQGPEAPGEIAEALRMLNAYGDMDVIIVGRGGGSFEDLMAFNSEEVVKAIFESTIPVISAVGHEVDFTLADLVADLRAATPTQAAQLAVPEITYLKKELDRYKRRLSRSMEKKLNYESECLDRVMMNRIWRQPATMLKVRQEEVGYLEKRLNQAALLHFREKEQSLSHTVANLDRLSPLKVMQRGYALIHKEDCIIRSASQVDLGDELTVALTDADIRVKVLNKEKVYRWKS